LDKASEEFGLNETKHKSYSSPLVGMPWANNMKPKSYDPLYGIAVQKIKAEKAMNTGKELCF